MNTVGEIDEGAAPRVEAGSAALSGTMHSRKGSEMQVPIARSACRRSISQGWERKLLIVKPLVVGGWCAGTGHRLLTIGRQ